MYKDEENLKEAIDLLNKTSHALMESKKSFDLYRDGVLMTCDPDQTPHITQVDLLRITAMNSITVAECMHNMQLQLHKIECLMVGARYGLNLMPESEMRSKEQ